MKRCQNGTRRNKKTGNCEPNGIKSSVIVPKSLLPNHLKKCPKGTRRNKKTGNCEPKQKPMPMPMQMRKLEVSSNKKRILTRMLKLKRHIGPGLEKLRYCLNKTGECFAFGKYQSELVNFFQFINFNYQVSMKPIGVKSANGSIIEIKYQRDDLDAYAILKSSNEKNSDNLYYEYLVGKYFVNYWNLRMPCFVETYQLFLRNATKLQIIHKDSVKQACQHSDKLSLLIQHVHQAVTFNQFYDNNPDTSMYYLYTLFYQIYAPLAYLMYDFTHYDLHSSNVLLYFLEESEYIEFIYYYSVTKQIRFYTQHVCKMIDYGRCYANTPETLGLYDKLCQERDCNPNCGNYKGFTWLNDSKLTKKNFYISSRTNNISHDLRFAKNIFSSHIIYKDKYGTPPLKSTTKGPLPNHSQECPLPNHSQECPLPNHSQECPLPNHSQECLNKDKIKNVMDMKIMLEILMNRPNSQNFQESFIRNRTKKASLTVYLDGSKRPILYQSI